MNRKVRAQLEKLTNQQWSNIILALVLVCMIGFAIEPLASFMLLVLLCVMSIRASYEIAKTIDWFDDNVHSKVEMTRLYHLVYALGISILTGTVIAYIGATIFPFSPELFAVISPRVPFFILGLVTSAIGYSIAWRTIPNKKER